MLFPEWNDQQKLFPSSKEEKQFIHLFYIIKHKMFTSSLEVWDMGIWLQWLWQINLFLYIITSFGCMYYDENIKEQCRLQHYSLISTFACKAANNRCYVLAHYSVLIRIGCARHIFAQKLYRAENFMPFIFCLSFYAILPAQIFSKKLAPSHGESGVCHF